MYIIEKQGLEKQELLAQITAYYTTKVLGIDTNNVSLEFDNLEELEYGNVVHIDGVHLISINKDNGVTRTIEAVSHELRHVWQAKNGWEFDYTLPYHAQPHEIDAWKFMEEFTAEYKDVIYQEYLQRKAVLLPKKEESLMPPLEYVINSDVPEMVNHYEDKALAESIENARKAGVPEEQIIKNKEDLEVFMTGTTAADESSVAVKTKTEKDELNMENTKVITIEEHKAIMEELKAMVKTQIEVLQTGYEQTIEKLVTESEARTKELEEITAVVSEQDKAIKEAHTLVAEFKQELDRVSSLRKADARRIEKLQDEVGRAKLKLREHKAREINESKITELPEENVGKVIHARIVTAGKLDDVAQTIHEKAPEKIANAAEKTKDGIQWVADVTKSGVDLTARGTNYASEKVANAMTFVADKIAPTDETVIESILRVTDEGDRVAVFNGKEYKLDANGKLIF